MNEKTKIKKLESKKENSISQTRKTDLSKTINSTVDQIFFLHKTIGNQAVGKILRGTRYRVQDIGFRGQGIKLRIHTKLKISRSYDIYEQEADRVADAVMRIPDKHHIADSLCPIYNRHSSSAISNKLNATDYIQSENKFIHLKPG